MTTTPPPITLPDDVAEALELVSDLIRSTAILTTASVGPPLDDWSQGVAEGVEVSAKVIDAAALGVRRRRGEAVS